MAAAVRKQRHPHLALDENLDLQDVEDVATAGSALTDRIAFPDATAASRPAAARPILLEASIVET